jgi:hypothetical protein
MVKKVSLNIPDDTYTELASLSDFHKEDVKDVIATILSAVGSYGERIMNLGKEYKVPVKLNNVMCRILDAGFNMMDGLSNQVLDRLEVKGLYVPGDVGIDFDENDLWLQYDAIRGCNLKIDEFCVWIGKVVTLRTSSYIEVKKVNSNALTKLQKVVQNVEAREEFSGLNIDKDEECNIKIEEDEEFWTLVIECTVGSFGNLPSLKRMSKFVEQIFKKTGIE